MLNTFTIPEDIEQAVIPKGELDTGEYSCRIAKASSPAPKKFAVLYEISEEGPVKGAQIWENLDLNTERDRGLFGELLDTLGISRSPGEINLDNVIGRTLCISVEKNGRRPYVVGHRPDF